LLNTVFAISVALLALPAVSQEKPAAPQPPLVVAPAPPANAAPTTKPADDNAQDKAQDKPAEKLAEKPKTIALILPLSSKALGKAAEAARAGFIAAAEVTGKTQFEPRVYLAEDEAASMATLYRKATSDGAVAIVAGLTRDGATIVARDAGYLPTLALNMPGDLSRADANNFFHISLSLDWDARLAARAASDEGFRNAAVVYSNVALARRIQEAFEKEWVKQGGTIAARIAFSGDLNDGPKLKAAMEKPDAAKADVVFLAADMAVARFARPYLPQGLPVFATAQTFDPKAGAVENLDLDSVKYPEIPWFAERDHPAVMAYPRPQDAMPTEYERLYALGIDAWRIVYALVSAAPGNKTANDKNAGDKNASVDGFTVSTTGVRSNAKQAFVPIDGVTGRISLDGNQFVRALPLIEMRDGKPQVAKPAE
jgi:ABC-type branched-subunit amino acid transport system substrate-binding protein